MARNESVSDLYDRLKPYLVGLFDELQTNQGATSSTVAHELGGAFHTGTLDVSRVPDALPRTGGNVTGNITASDGVTFDGVDVSILNTQYLAHASFDAQAAHGSLGVHAHSDAASGGVLDHGLLSGRGDDDHGQYAAADGSGLTRSAYMAERLNLTLTAGDGLTGGGLWTTNRSVAVGAGTGIAVAADSVAVDQTFSPTWTGSHSFQQTLTTYSIIPSATDTYDLGSSIKLWNKGWLSELDAILFAQNTVTLLGGWLFITKDEGTLPADLSSGATTCNFGKAMTVGDFVLFRAAGAVEYMTVGSLVSGTTYNVTRNLDGSGANTWVAGTPFAVLGQSGNGRIELNAFDTPRIQVIQQGATYNAQTEMIRIGDLNGNWAYVAATYGIAIGEYAASKANLTYDTTNGLRLRNHSTTMIQLDNSGNATFEGALGFGTNGGIWVGSAGTFASPTTGLKMWKDTGVGRIYGYSGGTAQAGFNTSGEIEAGAGGVKLNSTGITINAQVSKLAGGRMRWMDGATQRMALYTQYDLGSYTASALIADTQLSIADENFNAAVTVTESGYCIIDADVIQLSADVVSIDNNLLLMGGTSFPTGVTNYISARTDFRGMFMYDGSNWRQFGVGSFTSFPGSPVTDLRAYRTDFRALFTYDGSAWRQISIGAFTSFPGSPVTDLRVYRTDFRAHFSYDGSAWRQVDIGAFTSFPGSPVTDLRVYRTDFRAHFAYDGSAWRQISVGDFTSSFPSSPTTNLRAYRVDRGLEYYYDGTRWLTVTLFVAATTDVRMLGTYPEASVATAPTYTVIMTSTVTDVYNIYIEKVYSIAFVSTTNSGSHFWEGEIDLSLIGGAATSLQTWSTAAIAANTTTTFSASPATVVSASGVGGVIRFKLRNTGTPGNLTAQWTLEYRKVG